MLLFCALCCATFNARLQQQCSQVAVVQDEKCEMMMMISRWKVWNNNDHYHDDDNNNSNNTTTKTLQGDGYIPPSWVLRDAWKSTTTNNFYPWPIQALGYCSALRRPSICLSVRPSRPCYQSAVHNILGFCSYLAQPLTLIWAPTLLWYHEGSMLFSSILWHFEILWIH